MNAAGTFIVGVVYGGGIWTSADTGTTWVRYPDYKNQLWTSVSCSSDGTVLVAVEYGGGIYISTNAGVLWQLNTTTTNQNWVSVTCSFTNGQYMYAAISGGAIWSSIDKGATWSVSTSGGTTAPVANWTMIQTNQDGTTVVGIVKGDGIYISRNFGLWNPITNTSGIDNLKQNWSSFSMDISGKFLVVAVNGGALYVSSNYGFIWTIIANGATQNNPWSSVAMNGSGNIFYAVENGGTVWQGVYASNQWSVSQNTGVAVDLSANGLTQSWSFVTCNLDGSRVMAVSDQVGNYLSVNSGANWVLNIGLFRSLITSIDGQILTVVYGGGIWKSGDFGVTWTLNSNINSQKKRWVTVSNATNLARILATTDTGETWISTDSGTTWTLGVFDFKAVASSNDGKKLVRVVYGGGIWLSTDSGYTWRLNVSTVALQNQLWNCVASSYDGRVLVAGVYNGGIWTSTDSGATWTMNSSPVLQNLAWSSVASNSDGTTLVATVYSGGIFTSNDYGVTWKNSISAFKSMAKSSDGLKCGAVIYGVGIYMSTDSGITWTLYSTGLSQFLSSSLLQSNFNDVSVNLIGYGWNSIACNSDGSMFVACAYEGLIYAFYRPTLTWYDTGILTISTNKWSSVVINSTTLTQNNEQGIKISACSTSGEIWTANYNPKLPSDSSQAFIDNFYLVPINISTRFNQVAMNSDGSLMFAIGNDGFIYISNNFGINWNKTTDNNLTSQTFRYICCDGLGKTVIAAAYQTIWISNNYGNSWFKALSNSTPTLWFSGVACDTTGQVIYVSDYSLDRDIPSYNITNQGNVYMSNDRGLTWKNIYSDTYAILGINCSSNGSYISTVIAQLVGSYYFKYAYMYSNSFGSSWITSTFDRDYIVPTNHLPGSINYFNVNNKKYYNASNTVSIALNRDGSKICLTFYASTNNDQSTVIRSTDGGISWSTISQFYTNNYLSYINCNSDGTVLILVSGCPGYWNSLNTNVVNISGIIFVSFDFGNTWVNINNDATGISLSYTWVYVRSNNSGSFIIASTNDGYIYTSLDRGNTWNRVNNTLNYKWTSIACDSSGTKLFAVCEDGGIYSLNSNTNNLILYSDIATQKKKWCAIACDSTGNNLIASAKCGQGLYVSNNSGVNWALVTQPTIQNNWWSSVAVNTDGTTFYVCGLFGSGIWSYNISTNNWSQYSNTQYINWNFIHNTAFGNNIFAGDDTGFFWNLATNVFVNNIYNFSKLFSPLQQQYWTSCSINSTTSILTAEIYNGYFIQSFDLGNNWNRDTVYNIFKWKCLKNIDGYNGNTSFTVVDSSNVVVDLNNNLVIQKTGIYVNIKSVVYNTKIISAFFKSNLYRLYNVISTSIFSKFNIIICTGFVSYNGICFLSTDNNITFNKAGCLNDINNPGQFWSSLIVNPTTFFVVGTYGIQKTIDGGKTWAYKFIDSYRGNSRFESIVANSTGQFLIATRDKVYFSTDYGESWNAPSSPNISLASGSISNDTDYVAGIFKKCYSIMSSIGSTVFVYNNGSNQIWKGTGTPGSPTSYTWTDTNAPNYYCNSLVGSSDLLYVYMCTDTNGVYTYNYNSNSWSNIFSPSNSNFSGLTCDPTGQYLTVIVNYSYIYNSIDYGSTWYTINALPFDRWETACCNPSNNRFYLASNRQVVQMNSISSGNTSWQLSNSKDISWNSITSSSDGSLAFATAVKNGIWKGVVSNTGRSWAWTQTTAPVADWSSITCDVSGIRVVATSDTNSTYTSYDSGNTWIDVATFNASAASTSGTIIYNVVYGGGIWYSSDTGYTLTKISNNLSDASWNAVVCNSSGSIAAAAVLGGPIYVYNTNYTWYSCSVRDLSNQILFMTGSLGVDSSRNIQVFYNNNQFPNILSSKGIGSNTFGTTSVNMNLSTFPFFDKLYPSATFYDLSGNSAIFWDGGSKINTGYDFSLNISYSPIPTPWIMVSDVNNSNWKYLQMDASGGSLYAIDTSNVTYSSRDGGNSWNLFDLSTFKTVATSADGNKVFGVVYGGDIWSSQDTGNTWSRAGLSYQNWSGISCDLLGNNVFAAVSGGNIWISSNATWSEYSAIPSKNWQSIVSNSDGSRVVATALVDASYTEIWSLTRNGYTWTSVLNTPAALTNTSVDSVSSDYSGKTLYAAVNNYGIWNSANYGVTWNGIISQFPLTYRTINLTVTDTGGVVRTFDGFFGVDRQNLVKTFYNFNAVDINTNILVYTGNDRGADYRFDLSNNVFSSSGTAIASIPALDAVYGATEWNLAYQNGLNLLSYKNAAGVWSTLPSSAVAATLRNIVFTSQKLAVAVGQGGNTIAYSVDTGNTWTGIAGASSIFSAGNRVVWNGGKFLAAGQPATNGSASADAIAYSYDGINWYPVFRSGFGVSGVANDVYYCPVFNSWVAVGADISNGALSTVFYSGDGNYWQRAANNPFGDHGPGFNAYVTSQNPYVRRGNGIGFGVSCNGNIWVATGYSPIGNSLAYSADAGRTWVSGNADLFRYGWGSAVKWNGYSWLAVGRGRNVAATSTDGMTWKGESSRGLGSASATFNRGIHDVVWNGGVWLAVGQSGFAGNAVAYSVNGSNVWQTGAGYTGNVSWQAPFANGLLTESIYNVRADSTGSLVLTGSFPASSSGYTLTAGTALIRVYPNPNSGNKFSPVDVVVPTTTSFANLGLMQTYINDLLNGYQDPYNGNHNVLAGSYVTFLTSGSRVNVTFNVAMLKTLVQQNYNVVFADPSNNSGVFQSPTNAWWNYLAVWQPVFDLSNAAYNPTPNVNYSQIVGIYPIPDQAIGVNGSNILVISDAQYANSTFVVQPQSGVDGLTGDYAVTIKVPDGSYTLSTLKRAINQQFATATVTNPVTGTTELLCLGSVLDTSMSSLTTSLTYFRLNINHVFHASDYALVFYDPFSFSTVISGKNTLQNVSWDTTMGWILGFRNYTDYPLFLLLNGSTDGAKVLTIQGDTAVSVNIYNYFMITLDDYNQNHLNDGLVTTTQQEQDLPLPSYANRACLTCNPTNPGQMLIPTTNTDSTASSFDVTNARRNLTQNQVYSAQAVIDQTTNNVFNPQQNNQAVALKQKKNTRYYSNGPFAQDVFALVPLKTSGQQSNTVYVDYSGTLQNQERLYFGPVNIHRMTVSLINDRGEVVDLNGANWSFSILCEQLYQQQKT
jgi:photosystem II stability/assembly factor-like uncharacterized protein